MTAAIILGAIELAKGILDWVAKQKKVAEQNDSWTPEERAKINVAWLDTVTNPAWQTDDETEITG